MSCPHKADDCRHPSGVHAVLHYRCRTCTRCHTNRVTAMAAAWCTDCLTDYVINRPATTETEARP